MSVFTEKFTYFSYFKKDVIDSFFVFETGDTVYEFTKGIDWDALKVASKRYKTFSLKNLLSKEQFKECDLENDDELIRMKWELAILDLLSSYVNDKENNYLKLNLEKWNEYYDFMSSHPVEWELHKLSCKFDEELESVRR